MAYRDTINAFNDLKNEKKMTIVNKIYAKLQDNDWKDTKKISFFSEKPTSVRRMIAILSAGRKKELRGREILQNLSTFLENRQNNRGLVKTNPAAKAFYENLKNVLNNLEEKPQDIDGLTIKPK